MCSPTAAISGGLQVAQGYAGWRAQQAQYGANKAAVNAENQAKRNAYNRSILQRDREWQQTLRVWNQELEQYQKTLDYNNDAAYGFGGAYQMSQRQTNQAFTEAAFANQDSLANLYQILGSGAATGQGGASVERFDTASLAAFGRENSVRAVNLYESVENQKLRDANTRRELESANNRAYARVAVAPQPGLDPLPPTFRAAPSAPSPFGTIVNTASGLFGAAQAGGAFGVGPQNAALKINQNAFSGSFNPQTPFAFGGAQLG